MVRLIDLTERFLIGLAWAAFLLPHVFAPHWWNAPLIISETLTVAFILARRWTTSVSLSPWDTLLALTGTMAFLLFRPGGESLVPHWFGTLIGTTGVLISISAKLSLGRRFGLVPANRGVQPSLAYAVVRHPMYLGYMFGQIGALLMNPTPWNLAVVGGGWALLIGRIYREEAWLMQDDAYQSYAAQTRFRLVPGVF